MNTNISYDFTHRLIKLCYTDTELRKHEENVSFENEGKRLRGEKWIL